MPRSVKKGPFVDLHLLKKLDELGVHSFEQIASWSPEQLEEIAKQLNIPAARIRKFDWVGRAKTLQRRKSGG